MKHLCACLLVLNLTTVSRADADALKEACTRWLHGNYGEARDAYEKLAKEPAQQSAAVIGLSRVLESQGEYDRALEVLAGIKPASAEVLARQAEVLYLRGRWDDALKTADQALALKRDNLLARWIRAQVQRDRGDVKQAGAEFRWFVRFYNETDTEDAAELTLIGLGAAEYARYYGLADQFDVILNDIYGDALRFERTYWPAEYLAGMLLLEKYNRPKALDAFEKALTVNPQAAEAHVGKGLIALQKYEIKQAEELAARALEINPNLPDGLRLRADVHLASGDLPTAIADLEKARGINPRDERTLGRLAACRLLERKQADFDALAAEVSKHNPRPGVFYFELAERLEERRRYGDAEKYYRQATSHLPSLSAAQNSLGMLYMRLGKETEARTLLTRAFDADPFNVRVSNTLKVLRHLDKYETIKTEHFELRFDPAKDTVLARFMAEYLENIYAELAEMFDYRPPGPILIEVFNNHEMFSGRVVALPDLHTIGASTGRMVAMVSPQGRQVGKPFNWARVIRHELVHVFNLEQTDFLCPHWLTEGLAVGYEGFARPQQWNELLQQRVPAGELMNLDNIHLGFIRPRSPADWHMAYCQSQLYVEYLQEKHGPKAIGEMLAAYRDGLDTGAVVSRVCKVDKAAFETGYRAYLQEIVKKLHGRPQQVEMTFSELRQRHEKDREDADLAARLAEHYLRRREPIEARKLADEVLAKKPGHPLASYVAAKLELAGGKEAEARKLLEAARDAQPPEPKVLALLGELYFNAKDFDAAARVYEQARKAEPSESDWLLELARVYIQAEKKDRLIEVLKELVPMDADDLDIRKRLARLLLDANQPDQAERYARQALEIDLHDAEAREALFKALAEQKKDAEAERLRRLFKD
jgi:tetratricopeptide (TPR) repeat protein